MILESDAALRALLARSRSVALVGASANPKRPSYQVFCALRDRGGFDISPINPAIAAVGGVTTYPSLAAYARERGAPDIVDVFRKASESAGIVREAIAIGARSVWFQYDVATPEGVGLAHDAGLDVVVDRCLKIEAARLADPRR